MAAAVYDVGAVPISTTHTPASSAININGYKNRAAKTMADDKPASESGPNDGAAKETADGTPASASADDRKDGAADKVVDDRPASSESDDKDGLAEKAEKVADETPAAGGDHKAAEDMPASKSDHKEGAAQTVKKVAFDTPVSESGHKGGAAKRVADDTPASESHDQDGPAKKVKKVADPAGSGGDQEEAEDTPASGSDQKDGTAKEMEDDAAAFDPIADVVRAFANDEFVIVLDSPNRENEGDLIIAASAMTPAKASFMIRYTSGFICVALSPDRAVALRLPQMVEDSTDLHGTAYTITVDGADPALTTGISATDRARTCNMLADPSMKPTDFRRPGHIVPLMSRVDGVRERRGHTEAAVDLCRLAGKGEAGAICELVTDGEVVEGKTELVGGGMMRRDECLAFGKQWGIKVCTIDGLVKYIAETEGVTEYVRDVQCPQH